jgi:hypothetical protein
MEAKSGIKEIKRERKGGSVLFSSTVKLSRFLVYCPKHGGSETSET